MADKFLSSIYTYPWDLTDEGLDRSLNRIADLARCQEVMLTPSYHVSTYFLPHNPRRPIYYGEDGAVYFRPEEKRFSKTRIRPRVSSVVDQEGYFERIVEAIHKRGLEFGAWIVYFYNHYLPHTYPEFAKYDAFGNPNLGQISPSPPDVQEYVVALTENIVEKYKPAAVHIESLSRLRWNYGFRNPKLLSEISRRCQFLLGLDFNPAAIAHTNEAGLDGKKFQTEVARWLRPRLARLPTADDRLPVSETWIQEEFGGRLKQYLEIARKSTTALWHRVARIIHEGEAKMQSTLATSMSAWSTDLDLSINRQLDRLTIGPVTGEEGRRRVQEILEQLRKGGKVMVSTQPGRFTEPAPLEKEVREAAAAGAAGCTFYNYGLLREEQLGFVGSALRKL